MFSYLCILYFVKTLECKDILMKNNEEKLKEFGARIKKFRAEKGYTIKDVALNTGIREKYLIKIEKGIAKRLTLNKVEKIIHFLNIKMSQLF